MTEANELYKKELEIAALQKNFGEFIESSKELEMEMEAELKDTNEKLARAISEKLSTEKRHLQSQERIQELSNECTTLHEIIAGLREQLSKNESEKKRLETENFYLEQQVRVLEISEDDLKYKLTEKEEDFIFLKGDLEHERVERKETESRLRKDFSTLISEMESQMNLSASESGGSSSTDRESYMTSTPDASTLMPWITPDTDRRAMLTISGDDAWGCASPSPIRKKVISQPSPSNSRSSPENLRFNDSFDSSLCQSPPMLSRASSKLSPRLNRSASAEGETISLQKTPMKDPAVTTLWSADKLADAFTGGFSVFSIFTTNEIGASRNETKAKRVNRFESAAAAAAAGPVSGERF